MYGARRDAQVSVQTGSEEERGGGGLAGGGLREDKGRSRSKNSIISADARTSLGFPGADNGALFEESFCARPRYPGRRRSLFPPFSYASTSFALLARTAAILPVLLFSLTTSHSFYRIKIQSYSRAKEARHNG